MEQPFIETSGTPKGQMYILYPFYLFSLLFYIILAIVEIAKSDEKESSISYRMLFTIPLLSKKDIFWTKQDSFNFIYFFPERGVVYGIFAALIGLSCAAFLLILIKGFVIKENQMYHIAFGSGGKVIPLAIFFSSLALLVPLIQDGFSDEKKTNEYKEIRIARYGCGIAFSGISLFLYGIGYFFTEGCNGSILAFIFKKCFLSVNISFHLMHLMFSCVYLNYFKNSLEDIKYFIPSSWICMVVYGILISVGTFVNSDIVFGFIGLLFEISFIIYSTGIPTSLFGEKIELPDCKSLKTANLVSSIILSIVLAIIILITGLVKQKGCFN